MTPLLHIPKRIVVHCSASPNGHAWPINLMRAYHMNPPPEGRGWSDVGYHGVIQPNGDFEQGRPLNYVGAHVAGHNNGALGICLIGTDKFTRAQFDKLRYMIDSWRMVYNIKEQDIYCHNQFDTAIAQGKSCPNFSVNELFTWYHLKDERAINRVVIEGA